MPTLLLILCLAYLVAAIFLQMQSPKLRSRVRPVTSRPAPPKHYFVEERKAEALLEDIPGYLMQLFQAGLSIRVGDHMVRRAENPSFTFVPN
jgi:hypothetical protein